MRAEQQTPCVEPRDEKSVSFHHSVRMLQSPWATTKCQLAFKRGKNPRKVLATPHHAYVDAGGSNLNPLGKAPDFPPSARASELGAQCAPSLEVKWYPATLAAAAAILLLRLVRVAWRRIHQCYLQCGHEGMCVLIG